MQSSWNCKTSLSCATNLVLTSDSWMDTMFHLTLMSLSLVWSDVASSPDTVCDVTSISSLMEWRRGSCWRIDSSISLIASASTSSADNFCSVVVNHVIMSSISVNRCAGTFGTLWNVVWILLNSRLTAFHLLRMPIKHTSISCISSGVQSVRYLSRISTKLLMMGEFLSRVNRVSSITVSSISGWLNFPDTDSNSTVISLTFLM